ncbi:Mrp/NBP35 family ATP-binding protein [uncultured Roseovarius sp.]|uniref:Mrp/NBP35 family ATP-binding protein n=1 Tax=uncultured Roseovarius sp. TaxID=293344 RepID=UPI0026356E52|nr:Mrp/NBP35 family ATP-binding protein [uncultured Roseovarius sp.]
MSDIRAQLENRLTLLELPDGGNLVSRDMVRALVVEGDEVRFVIEAPSPEAARLMEPLRAAAERAALSLPGVSRATVALTAHAPPPSLKLGQHPKGGNSSIRPEGIASLLAVASGKGGVGKSTVAANLAVALARQGRRVGLLDADIHGPSLPRMMGLNARPQSADGERITPLEAHGVKVMSIGLMLDPAKAVIWRGPMLMGALQQMLSQVDWGVLDVLVVDLPPGTGDVQLTLSQRARPDGAIIVSTPQDVALLDARKAMDMFRTLEVPLLGMIENMSFFKCPDCGHEAHIFGHGGVRVEAEGLDLPLLAALPIDLETRLSGDSGHPVASGESPVARAYGALARHLIEAGRG